MSGDGKIVAKGTWLYQGVAEHSVEIVRYDCDLAYASWLDDLEYCSPEERQAAFKEEPVWKPIQPGPDGWLYYVQAEHGVIEKSASRTLEQAKLWAESQPWAPINWQG